MNLRKSEILGARVTLSVALILMTYLTTAPLPSEVVGAVNDKLSHLLAFYALTLLGDFSFPESGLDVRKIAALLTFGIMIELIQHGLPYREFSLADLAANAIGILAYWLSIPLLRRLPRIKARWV